MSNVTAEGAGLWANLRDWRHVKSLLRIPGAWIMSVAGLYFTIWYIVVVEPVKPCFHWVLGLPFWIGGIVMFYNDVNNRLKFNHLIHSDSRRDWIHHEDELKDISLKLPNKYRRAFLDKRRAVRHDR